MRMIHPKASKFLPLSYPIKPIDTRGTKYSSFTYWSKKPENVISQYIKHYSCPGEVVLDPFSGSGVTAIESLILKRKAIVFDINPIAIYFARMLAIAPVNLEIIQKFRNQVLDNSLEIAFDLYATKCRKCGKTTQIESMLFDNSKPKLINYTCTCQKGIQKAQPSKDDLHKAKIEIESDFRSKNNELKLIKNPRKQIESKSPLAYFTPRNLAMMEHIWSYIQKLPQGIEKSIIEFSFLSKLRLMGKDYFRSTSSAASFLWIPKNNWIERNVLSRFFQSSQKVLKTKKIINKEIGSFYQEAKDPKDVLESEATIYLGVYDAKEINIILPRNSIDYILTDPPYADQALYLEYSLLWQPWFPHQMDLDNEIVVTDSPERPQKKRNPSGLIGHGEKNYLNDLEKTFLSLIDVLKQNRWLNVWFRCKNDLIWDGFVQALRNAGFEKINAVRQPINTSTWNRGINPNGTLNEYLILAYRKTCEKQHLLPPPEGNLFFDELKIICQNETLEDRTELTEIWSAAVSYFLSKYDRLPKELSYELLQKILLKK